ncbi:hypothetical protein ACFVH9_13415 [Streptomyces hirsutus]|uniref:hypothetical protein n=1 Tax=Streptomyces hirsutus TaxID=35620 RepID=UPI0036379B75
MTKSSRFKARLATVALAVGMGVAVSTVPAQAVPLWEVSGYSTDPSYCQYARGLYGYEQTGSQAGYPTYNAGYQLSAYDECDGDGQGSRLQISYKKYSSASGWYTQGWTTIAKSGQTATADLGLVRDVRLRICAYTTARGIFACGSVS